MSPVKAILEGFKNLITGEMDGIAKVRLQICKNCPHYSVGFCTKCFCINELKARQNQIACPLKKW